MLHRFAYLVSLGAVAAIAFAPAASGQAIDRWADVPVSTEVAADSVTVGERFTVTIRAAIPDSSAFSPTEIEPGNCVVVDGSWRLVAGASGTGKVEGRWTLLTLDLEAARFPAQRLHFIVEAGDTVSGSSDGVEIPVRHIAAQSEDLAPLRDQWEAPHVIWPWVVGAIAALLLAAIAVLLWRRRRGETGMAPVVVLPADIVALQALADIQRRGLAARGEFKEHYTLVVDVLRRYLESRYGVDAMDRTSDEILNDLSRADIDASPLDAVMHEADLVKFARLRPGEDQASRVLECARDFVVKTTPKPILGDDTALEEASG